MNGSKKNTKLLVLGFAVILTGMAGMVALFVFHISTIIKQDQLDADLVQKNLAVYKMRDAAEKRPFALFQVVTMDDYFERDAVRQKMSAYAAEFVDARAQITLDSLSDGERRALENILEAVRQTQPDVEDAMSQAVNDQWSPAVQSKFEDALKSFTAVHDALNVFVAEVETETATRRNELEELRIREMKVIPTLGVGLFFMSLGVGLFVIRREMSHTQILEQRVEERSKKLIEQETHYRTIIETAADGIISTDAKGCIESYNPAAERIFGYGASEVLGRSINMLMPTHDAVRHDGYVKDYIDGGKPKIIGMGRELRALRKDGTTLPIWLAVNRMMVGGEAKFVGIISDISQKLKTESEVRQLADDNEIVASVLRLALSSNNLKETLQEALELILDRQNLEHVGKGAIFLNNAKESRLEMCAISRMPEIVATQCRYVDLGDCLCGRAAATRSVVEKSSADTDCGDPSEHGENHGNLCMPINYAQENLGVLNLYIPDGHVLSDHDRRLAASVTDALAGIIHRHLYQQELVLAKERAELSSRTKTEFLANMSHELRTPLNAIIGYSEMMENEIFGPVENQKYKEYLEYITGSGRHLYSMINDLLDVSRIEFDEFPLEEDVFSFAETLNECIGTIKHRAEAAGNRVSVADAIALPSLYGDKRRIKQVLINMLHNAIKFTPMGGSITVVTEVLEGGDFRVLVIDTGIGIAPQDLETVFTMFGQVDGSLARKYDGVGLGLPLSRKLMEKQGGTLELQSEPGKGTIAIITVPSARVIWN
jgi:PAS domain S-box-containing protein